MLFCIQPVDLIQFIITTHTLYLGRAAAAATAASTLKFLTQQPNINAKQQHTHKPKSADVPGIKPPVGSRSRLRRFHAAPLFEQWGHCSSQFYIIKATTPKAHKRINALFVI